jgi:hypothetical protein
LSPSPPASAPTPPAASNVAGLAAEFREVDVAWQRLARRLYRASRGQQFGPNIDLVKAMGATIARIHEALGMPGYAPTFDDFR